jgi:putative PIN family toxin of toxin-antitoxin system
VITAVLDTNVLASGFVHPQPPPGQVLAAWRDRRFSLVVSDQILVELARTFDQPYFARHLTSDQRRANLLLLRDVAILTSLIVEVHGVATHREDDLILAAAVSAEADSTWSREMLSFRSSAAIKV